MGFQWTRDKEELLISLWSTDLSAREIALRLGDGATRNSVIGKANRMGLGSRARAAPVKSTVAPTSYAPNRGERYCQWPNGHPDEPNFSYCQKPVYREHPYCRDHARIAYRNLD